jgi:hypothetical protein
MGCSLSTVEQPVVRFKIQSGIMSVMRKRARWAILASIGALALLATACTGDAGPNTSTVAPASSASSSSAARTSASPTPTARPFPADVPLTGHNVKPGEKPPLYPAAARARTQDGANAFAEFFLRTVDWAYATANPSYMKHYVARSCGLCTGLAIGISKTAAQKHWYLGGRLTIHAATATTIAPVTASADFCSIVMVDETAQSIVDTTGRIFSGDGAHSGDRLKACTVSSGGSWQITYMAFLK